MSKSLEDVFDVGPVTVFHPDNSTTIVVPDGDENEDHIYARKKTYEVLDCGTEALRMAMRIARESEAPQAIIALTGLMKEISNISKNLITLNKDKAEASKAKITTQQPQQPSTQIGQQFVFTGASTDINSVLKDRLQKK